MRKSLVLAVAVGVLAGALVGPAMAAKKPKPVATTLYFHGSEAIGETESFSIVAPGYLPMDSTAPDSSEPKSKQLTNYTVGPNTQCAGNELFPVWLGDLTGTVVGDVKVTFHHVSTPTEVDVRIWPDVAGQLCTNETLGVHDYPEPVGEIRVTLAPGPGSTEAVMEGLKFKASSKLMVQLTPVIDAPSFGRVLYDAEGFDSKIQFNCIPPKGQKSCTP